MPGKVLICSFRGFVVKLTGPIMIVTVFLINNHYAPLYGQQGPERPTRQSSLAAFSSGDYEKALIQFRQLLSIYPGDPLYKYYSGICLVQLERDPEQAATLLRQAQAGSSSVSNVPPDVLFWLGRSQQLSGLFDEALLSFRLFSDRAGRKVARDMEVQKFITQCESRLGSLPRKKDVPAESPPAADPVSVPPAKSEKEAENETKVVVKAQEEVRPLDRNFDMLLSEAVDYQREADSLEKLAEQRALAPLQDRSERSVTESIRAKADSLQNIASGRFAEAQEKMNSVNFTGESTKAAISSDTAADKPAPEPQTKNANIGDQVIAGNSKLNDGVTERVDAGEVNSVQVRKKTADFYMVFDVREGDQGLTGGSIEINPELPPGLIYRIQVAVFRNPVAVSYFKGITPVYGLKPSGSTLTTYYAGLFRKHADAAIALKTVRQKGFKDAFIASFLSGKAVTPERAASLEKEWAAIPLMSAEITQPDQSDTIPPTLAFRVVVIRDSKPVDADKLTELKKIAGSRGLDTYLLENGEIVYLIGMFITWESAEEYASLLVRNGYRDAKTGAWLGKKEIPVETARQLFEKIE